jgi:hypothetical protein
LRYALLAENAVNSIRAQGEVEPGNYVIVTPTSPVVVDLNKEADDSTKSRKE